jgi:hypothetical protein
MDPGRNPWSSQRREFALLQRIDIALAALLADAGPPRRDEARAESDASAIAQRHRELLGLRGPERWRWIGGVLRLRGFSIQDEDVRRVFARGLAPERRIDPASQEHRLITGLASVLDDVVGEAEAGRLPTGGALVSVFEVLVRDLPRFRGGVLRKDVPWDGMLHVHYPDPARLEALLAEFDAEHDYRDIPALFRSMHPVRRAFRVFWRFARIAPFSDFNTVTAFVAMTWYLLAHGYPAILPEPPDRAVLHRLVAGTPPKRLIRFENRMLARLEGDGSDESDAQSRSA